ncbi:MAG: lipocalin family protein [Pseudomonadota bacterium]
MLSKIFEANISKAQDLIICPLLWQRSGRGADLGVKRLSRSLILAIAVSLSLAGCLGVPEGVQPVTGFEAERYLGRWYEIARLDHSFERDLVSVSATYSRNGDGSVRVINQGYDLKDEEWSDIEGVAKFVEEASTAYLKVSFFGPFYGSYVVFELDKDDYSYAFVSGYNEDYLWLLARQPSVDTSIKEMFVARATELGFATEELIWVDHSKAKLD